MTVGQALIYNPPDPYAPGAGRLWQYVSTASIAAGWVDIGLVRGPEGPAGPTGTPGAPGAPGAPGSTGPAGATGATGPTGPGGATGATGPAGPAGATGAAGPAGAAGVPGAPGAAGADGTSTLIVGSFGAVRRPAELPATGLIPVDWDGPGRPGAAQQLAVGESMYHVGAAATGTAAEGHLFQYVSTADNPTGYLDVGLIRGPTGPAGPTGATGPAGATGPTGAAGPTGATGATGAAGAAGATGPAGPGVVTGGTADQPLVKIDGTNHNTRWGGAISVAGVTASGNMQFSSDGTGVFTKDGGGFYKKTGGGVVIREHTNGTQPQIENNDGTGGRDIIDTANAATALAETFVATAEGARARSHYSLINETPGLPTAPTAARRVADVAYTLPSTGDRRLKVTIAVSLWNQTTAAMLRFNINGRPATMPAVVADSGTTEWACVVNTTGGSPRITIDIQATAPVNFIGWGGGVPEAASWFLIEDLGPR
jgi:hypothetical protein